MNVHELNAGQLEQLKQSLIEKRSEKRGEGTSYGELADANEIISDEEVFAEYEGTDFVEEDFCN